MQRRMNMIERTRKMKIKLKNDPLKPMASIKSMQKMQMYINPTSFVTNIPKIGLEIKFAFIQKLNYALITALFCCRAGVRPWEETGTEICVFVNFSTYKSKSGHINSSCCLRGSMDTSIKFILISI